MIPLFFFVFISGMVSAHSYEPYRVPLSSSIWGYFTPPVLKRPQQLQTPLEAMVDLTNHLGISILQDHSYSKGNFAFSPYGVASVLVVLYEGARGESANQIHHTLGFPSNKDVLRMGFRDIHRHLKSYFSHEGFLSGITLNKNSSSLKPEYKKILKYYGYDVDLNLNFHENHEDDKDAKPSTQGAQTTKATATTTPLPNTAKSSSTTEAINKEMDLKNETTVKNSEQTTTAESNTEGGIELSTTTLPTTVKQTVPTTENEIAEGESELPKISTLTTMEENLPTTTKINMVDSELDASTTTTLNENELLKTTTESADGSSTDETITTVPTTESNTEEPTTTEAKKWNEQTEEKLSEPSTVYLEDNIQPEILEPDDNKENKFQKTLEFGKQNVKCKKEIGISAISSVTPCEEERIGKTEGEPVTKALESTTESEGFKLDNGMLIPQPSEEPTTLEETDSTGFFDYTTGPMDFNKESEDSPGRKFLNAVDERPVRRALASDKEVWQKNFRKLFDSKTKIWDNEPRKKPKTDHVRRYKRTIADYLKWPLHPDLSLQLQNGMYDTHVSRNAEMYRNLPRRMFLVDGSIDTPVPMMTYTNVFPYGYIPKLHAKALEFPLDDIRYKLLIVLPIERRGLRQLIYDLTDFPVRDILKCLRPTRVEVIIPTFMVEGFVILTSSLQKLGIWDVFDPRKANLSGMSVDPELYVRNIEQSVTVVIRNYVEILDIQTRTMAARYLEQKFQASHPFVYFVLDTATNIALMAGQMLDPLNSRIY